MTPERIFRSARTARDLVPYNLPRPATLLASRKLAACTIAMSVEPLKAACSRLHPSNCRHVNFEQGQFGGRSDGVAVAAQGPSPTWRSFLHNHMHCLAAIDMFVVVTATFRLLYALIVLGHDRRRVIHFEVTENPTQDWLARQMTEAFPWETAPRYLLRDRDASYGQDFRDRVQAMDIEEVVTAPRSPWQNPYVERIIGSIRRECLNDVIIFD